MYYFCTDATTWEQARARCQQAGTDLAVVQDEAENAWLAGQLREPSWLGMHDRAQEGQWVWIEPGGGEQGEPVGYEAWRPTKPDNCLGGVFGQQDCGRLSPNGGWDDSDCDGGCTEGDFAYVCESYP